MHEQGIVRHKCDLEYLNKWHAAEWLLWVEWAGKVPLSR